MWTYLFKYFMQKSCSSGSTSFFVSIVGPQASACIPPKHAFGIWGVYGHK